MAKEQCFDIDIDSPPETVWDAITNPAQTTRYYHGSAIETDWKTGSALAYRLPDGFAAITGEVVEVEAPRRLVTTFVIGWDPDAAAEAPSQVCWEVTPRGAGSHLRLTHTFDSQVATPAITENGWMPILASMKSLLETGEPLPMPEM